MFASIFLMKMATLWFETYAIVKRKGRKSWKTHDTRTNTTLTGRIRDFAK